MTEIKKELTDELTITVDPEKINNELVKQNITEQVLAEMKENFMVLKIAGLDDKEGYKKVEEARKLCKNTRILATKICKNGREAAIAEQKAWIAKEKDVVARISEMEEYLESQTKVIDDEKAKIKAQKEAEEQERLQTRIANLNKCRMEFNGVEYRLGPELIITATEVKLMDDFTFAGFYAKVEAEFNRLEAIRIEEEKKAKERAEELAAQEEKLKKEREEFEAKQAEFAKKEQEAKDKAEAEAKKIAEQQAEFERKAAEEKAALEAEKKKEVELRVKQRASIMHGLGMSFTGDKFLFHDISVDLKLVEENSAEDFQKIIDDVTPRIVAKKEELQKAHEAEVERKAQEKLAADKAAEEKAIADKKAAEEKEAALKPDRDKILVLSAYVKACVFPELTTDAGKAKLEEIKVQFTRFGDYLDKAAETLK